MYIDLLNVELKKHVLTDLQRVSMSIKKVKTVRKPIPKLYYIITEGRDARIR